MKFLRNSTFPITKITVLFIIWFILFACVPIPFYEQTEKEMKNELVQQYNDDVNHQFKTLQMLYKNKLDAYNEDVKKYDSDLESYNSYMSEYNQSLEKYKATFAEEKEKYDIELKAYNKSADNYKKAYDSAYANAENSLLKQGIGFTVDVSCSMDYNNHVGNEWYYRFYINGSEVSRGEKVILSYGKSVSFKSVCTEDDSYPDVGSTSGSVTPSKDYFKSGFTTTQSVTVREDRGRYSGNTAGFTIQYTLTPDPYTVIVNESALPAVSEKPNEPIYNPPKPQEEEPIEPTAPTEPTKKDVNIQYPDLEEISVTIIDVYAHNIVASLLMIFSTIVIAYIGWRFINKNKRDTFGGASI